MKTHTVILRCQHGLHLRVASEVTKIAQKSGAAVHIQCDGCPRADACSVLQLLMLGAPAGTPLEISADGPEENETAVLRALAGVFEGGSGI
ncbi:MAG: HPr family phosphocarrier protein [Verrucomicrobiota bacterium]|jgi:phosphocarrier protein NPr|nr:HPr family phosphocarrier protein [Verrucomicrobiota bacterium]